MPLEEQQPPPSGFRPVAVEASDLGCSRGGQLIFSGLSFAAAPGTLTAVVGPNGVGKSSLLRLLAGLLAPAAGRVRLSGSDDPKAAIHYLGHADGLKPPLTLRETLRFWAAVYQDEGRGPEEDEIACAADRVGLGHALELPAGVLSAGQRRRAGLARLLLCPRPLWLLDEPAAALDRQGEVLLGGIMRAHLAQAGVIVAATHGDLPVAPDAVLDLARAG